LCETWLSSWEEDHVKDLKSLGLSSAWFCNNQTKVCGRPYGGLGWVYHDELENCLTIKKVSEYISTCEISSHQQYLVIGIYMPTNDIAAYKNEISIIENIIKDHKRNKKVMIVGDFNACIDRMKSDNNTRLNKIQRIQNKIKYIRYPNDNILLKFLTKNNLEITSRQYTQYSYNTFLLANRQSNIDNIILVEATSWMELSSINVVCHCCCGPTCWDPLNLGDHRAIRIEIKIRPMILPNSNNTNDINKSTSDHKINWEIQWMKMRYQLLMTKHCELSKIDDTIDNLIQKPSNQSAQALMDHFNSCILLSKIKIKTRRLTGKNRTNNNNYNWETIEAIKNKKLHNDKTEPATKLLNSHYRREQRRLVRKQNSEEAYRRIDRINAKFQSKSLNGFWQELKHQTKATKDEVCIDIKTLETHYKNTMNKPEGEEKINIIETQSKIDNALELINNKIGEIEISEMRINKHIDNLKNKKACGFNQIENEAYKLAPRDITVRVIKILFETIINHKLKPELLNIGVLCPIIKDNKAANNDLNNIRPITLSEPLAIILEGYLLEELQAGVNIHELQFGFRKNYSTQHAIFVLRETILQKQMEKTPLYICFLDFSKAFDKINKVQLVFKLINYINLFILQLMITYIMIARIQIKNESNKSGIFEVSRGVKQGGPASPFLFAWYVNDMIHQITEEGRITGIYDIRSGMLCYADDTTVASNNISDLEHNTTIISKYCTDNEIKLNESKTKWMKIGGTNKQNESLKINEQVIEKVERFKFLGFEITSNMKYYEHVATRINKSRNMIYALNKIGFGSYRLAPRIKTFMYGVYARSILTYGFENIYFNKRTLNEIRTYESTIIKRALYLPKHSSVTKIYLALNITPIDTVIKTRKLKFLIRLESNDLTKTIIEKQCLRVTELHKQSLVREIIENHLTKPTPNIANLGDLISATEKELTLMKNKLERTDEAESINYLLNNRTRNNNITLYNLICKYG
jgi:hypothetical protein